MSCQNFGNQDSSKSIKRTKNLLKDMGHPRARFLDLVMEYHKDLPSDPLTECLKVPLSDQITEHTKAQRSFRHRMSYIISQEGQITNQITIPHSQPLDLHSIPQQGQIIFLGDQIITLETHQIFPIIIRHFQHLDLQLIIRNWR